MPPKRTPEQIGIALLVAAEVPNFLAGMLPSIFTIQRFHDEESRDSIRKGEVIGAAMAIFLGIAASIVADDTLPLTLTIIVLLVLIGAYEYALANPHRAKLDIANQEKADG